MKIKKEILHYIEKIYLLKGGEKEAMEGKHDDLVMSTLLAYDCLQSGSYSIL